MVGVFPTAIQNKTLSERTQSTSQPTSQLFQKLNSGTESIIEMLYATAILYYVFAIWLIS